MRLFSRPLARDAGNRPSTAVTGLLQPIARARIILLTLALLFATPETQILFAAAAAAQGHFGDNPNFVAPTPPTSPACDNSDRIATTAFVAACAAAGVVNTQSGSYTIAPADCNSIVFETGAFQTLTLPASLTGFPSYCPVRIVNGSSSRAQKLANFPASLPSGCGGACLWPNQGITVGVAGGAWVVISAPGRWKAPSPGGVQLYASPSGSNNNDCLAAASPCGTIQNALNIVQGSIDFAPELANIATINLATGTYSECLQWYGPLVGAEDVTVLGNTGSPASYVITCTGGGTVIARDKSTITFSGVELVAATSGQSVITSSQFATVDIGNSILNGNASGDDLLAQEMGTINATGPLTIGTSVFSFAAAQSQGHIDLGTTTVNSGVTVTYFVNTSFGAGVLQNGGTITNNGTVTNTCTISFLGWLNRNAVTYPGTGTCTPTNGGQIN